MSGGARKESGAGKKFQTYNINDTYRGGRPETRTGAGAKGHGMTSLGKIQSRRMPGPSSLPSLRTENAGNDPDINLVPSNSAGWGGGGAGGSGKEKEEKEAPTKEPPTTWGSTGEQDESGSTLPQHLQGDFPTLRDHQQQHEGGRRERPPDGPPTGWGGGGPDGKQQTRGGPPHRGYYSEGTQWGEPYGGPPPPGQMMGPPGPYGPPPPGPHPHHPRGRGPPREGSIREAHHQMFRPYPPHRPRPSHHYRGEHTRQMQGEASQDISRPCLVKEDELKNLEVSVDEDDGGWAGHHAEVDYSKEVVFDDSDEELEDKRERSISSHTAWERMEDEGGRRHKHPAAMLQKAEAGGREVARLQHQLASEDHPPYQVEEGHHYPPYEQRQAKGGHYSGRESHQGPWAWHHPSRRAWDRPPEIQRRNLSSDEGDWRHADQLMQGHVNSLLQRSESTSSKEDLERSDDFGAEAPSHAREPMKSRQQLRIMMREITDTPSPDSQVKDVAVAVTTESKPPQGWSVTAQQPPPPQKARSPVSTKEASTEEEQLHSPVDSIATARAAASVATKTAWDASNRGPVSTGRRLYEPEGQASAKKFHMYKRIHDKDHNGQDKKPSGSSGNEPADTPTTPGEGKVALLKGDKESLPSEGEDIAPVQKGGGAQAPDVNAEIEGSKGQKKGSERNQKAQQGRGRMPSRGEEAKNNAKQPGDGGRQPHGDLRRSRDRKQQQDNSRHPNEEKRQPPSSVIDPKDANHQRDSKQTSDDVRRPSVEVMHKDCRSPDQGSKSHRGDSRQSLSDNRVTQDSRPPFGDTRQPRSDESHLRASRQTQEGTRQSHNDSKQPHSDTRQTQRDSKQPHSDTRQPQGNSRQPQGDSRRSQGDSQQHQSDSRRPHGDRQPQGDHSRGPHVDSRQPHGDSRRPHGDSRRPQGGSRQPQGNSRGPQGDVRHTQGDSGGPRGDGPTQSSLQRSHGDARPIRDDQRQPHGDNSKAARGRRDRGRRDDPRKNQEAWKHERTDKESPAPEGRATSEQRKEGSHLQVASEGADTVEPVTSEESQKSSTASGRERLDPHSQHPKEPRARPIQKDDPPRGHRASRDDHQRPTDHRDKRHENRHSREPPYQEIEWEGESKDSLRRGARQPDRRAPSAAKQEGGRSVQSRGKPKEYPAAAEKPLQSQEAQQTGPVVTEMDTVSVEGSKQDYQQAGRGARGRGQRGDQDGSRAWPGSREARQREPRKPGSASATDSRPPRREGGGRDRSRKEPRHPDAVHEPRPVVRQPETTLDIVKESEGTREVQEVPTTDPAASIRSHDVAQLYDLSSPQVFVVDQTEGPDTLLSPVDDGDFTEVVSKREKRDKKEKKEVPKRFDDSGSSQQRGVRKGGIHGSREEVPSSRSQVKQGSHAPPGSRGRGRHAVDGTRVPGARAPGGRGTASQWEATYSKSVSGAQLSPSVVLPGAEPSTTLTPLTGSQVQTMPTPSPGVIGSGIPSPTPQNTPRYLFSGSTGGGMHPLAEGERQADSGSYTLFSGLSGDVFHSLVPVSRSDIAQGQESRNPSAPPPAAPGRILGKAIQDTIMQEHPKAAQQTSGLKQPQLQQGDGRLVLQPQATAGFAEKGCASEVQGQPQQSSSERPQRPVQQQEAGCSAPGRGRGTTAGRSSGPRTHSSHAPRHPTGSRGSDRSTTEGRGSSPATSEPHSRHAQMPRPPPSAPTTGRAVQASSGSDQQTRDSQDKPIPPRSVAEERKCLSVSLPSNSNRDLSVAEKPNASHAGPPTTQQGGQKDGVREFNRSTAPDDGAGSLEFDPERSQDRGSGGKVTPGVASGGGFISYASAVKSGSRPSSAASTASNEGEKHGQLDNSVPTHQEAHSVQGEMKQVGGYKAEMVENDSEPPVISDTGVVEAGDVDPCRGLVVMGPVLLQPPDVCEPGEPDKGQISFARLSSKPVAHVKPQQPVVKAGAVSASDVHNTFPSAAADIALPTVEAFQGAPPMEQHQLHSAVVQHGDRPLTAPEPPLGDVPDMVSAIPETYATEGSTGSSEVSHYQVNIDHTVLAVQVEKTGLLPGHLPSPIPLYVSPMDRVPSVSSLPECEQATVEGHSEQAKSHEELLQAVEDREDGDLVSKQLRVSAIPFIPSEPTVVPAKEDQVSSMGGVHELAVQPGTGAAPQTPVADQLHLSAADPSQSSQAQVPQVSLPSLHVHSASLGQQQRLQSVEPSPSMRMVLPASLHAAAFGVSHPLTLQSYAHLIQPHPHSMQQHPHSVQPHSQSVQPTPHSVQPHPHSVQPHPHSVQPNPHSVQPLPQQTVPMMGHVPYHMANQLAAGRAIGQQFGYLQGMVQPPPRGPHPPPMTLLYGTAPNPHQGLSMTLPPAMLQQMAQNMLVQQHKRKAKEEGATFVSTPAVDPTLAAAKMRSSGQGVQPGRPVVLPPGYPVTLASGAEGRQVAAGLGRQAPSVQQQQPTGPAVQPGVAFGSPRSHRHSRPQPKQPRSPLLPTPAATANIAQSSIWPPSAQAPQQQAQQNIQPPMQCPIPSDAVRHTTNN